MEELNLLWVCVCVALHGSFIRLMYGRFLRVGISSNGNVQGAEVWGIISSDYQQLTGM